MRFPHAVILGLYRPVHLRLFAMLQNKRRSHIRLSMLAAVAKSFDVLQLPFLARPDFTA
jgi:hypothetical protein